MKEFRQIRRDRRTVGVLVFIPAFLLVMFGYALDMDVTELPTAVYDADRSAESRALVDFFLAGGHSEQFVAAGFAETPEGLDAMLLDGRARVGLVVPAGFAAALHAGEAPAVQVLVDGVNATEAGAAVGYAEAALRAYAGRRGGGAVASLVDFRPRVWYNPELRSAYFLLPGLIAFILMIITVVATSLSVVRERELGSMEQLAVSPLRPHQLILGKLVPYAAISFVSALLVLAAGFVLFDMPMAGSYGLLLGATLVYLFGALGLGLVISTLTRTQETAFFLAVMMTLLPTFVLSGFVFPIENMPGVVQAVTYVIPARYFLVVLRAVMLKGVGVAAFWEDLALLGGFALVMFALGTARVRRLVG